ncbi:MAG TPA: hypothetical protein VJ951_08785 [Bacteroidales bacterium]|nr:hypothetical protein [Bacteroidales bacterium]
MKTNTIICILFSVIALLIISCGGEVIDIPDANRPLFSEGDSFVFKDLCSDTYDTMVVSISHDYDDHDEDLIEYFSMWYVNTVNSEIKMHFQVWPTGSIVYFLNIRYGISSDDKALDSLFIDGKQYTNAYLFIPNKESSRTDELEYLIYDYNYGLLKYKYYEGPEFVLDTVISSALY